MGSVPVRATQTAAHQRPPLLDSISAPTNEPAMVEFITHTVGWKISGRYNALSYEVNKALYRGSGKSGLGAQLRQSVAIDPKLQVLIVHVWGDLSCPFMPRN